MTRRLFILRHGETQFNAEQRLQGHCDSPLTDRGQAQARNAGRTLQQHLSGPPAGIYSSPLGRALQTASLISAALGHPGSQISAEPRLMEFALGDWEQQSIPELQRQHPGLLDAHDWYLQAPRAESFSAVSARLQDWLSELPAEGEFIMVSHALTGMVLRGLLSGLSYADIWQQDRSQDAFFILEKGVQQRVDCRIDTA